MGEHATPVRAGSLADLRRDGRLLTKIGPLPVLVVWHEGRAWAIEDRCPHMGFPLHRGTCESGMLTCHWHHARFDLESGSTLDPWADDAVGFDVVVDGSEVFVSRRDRGDEVLRLQRRLHEGLEQGLTLVMAKAVLGLLESDDGASIVVRTALDFGIRNRADGWGAGLTVLTAMANVLPHLSDEDKPLALVHALAFVARDTANRPPRFGLEPLETTNVPPERLAHWYRRFVETRSADGAERTLATALAGSASLADAERMMFAACTDHVFIDEGHTIDFTNKAVEVLAVVGVDRAGEVLTSLVAQTCRADRSEESSEWLHPHDLATLIDKTVTALAHVDVATRSSAAWNHAQVAALGWRLLDDDPDTVAQHLVDASADGATAEQLARAVAYAASLRITRFHTQNDHGDWNSVHHAFTAANAVHQAVVRDPTPELVRGIVHGALRVYLDRFLNIPAARPPERSTGSLEALTACFDVQGAVDEAGGEAYGYLRAGGDRHALIAALGGALVREDGEFHWFQVYEAGVRQALAWPSGSEESALVLTGLARFLAAHTPTRRELPTVVRIATRLRRGEKVFEDS